MYWQRRGTVFRAPKAGGLAEALSTQEADPSLPHAPARIGDTLRFGTQLGVRRIALPAGGPSVEAFTGAHDAGSAAPVVATSDGARIAWGMPTDGQVRVYDGLSPAPRLVATAQSARAVAVDGAFVYWVNADGRVFRADVTTNPIVPVTLGVSDVNPSAMVVAGDDLYVATWGPNLNTSAGILGSVYRFAKTPSPTVSEGQLLFRGPFLVSGLAVDERAIYFSLWWASSVFRLAR